MSETPTSTPESSPAPHSGARPDAHPDASTFTVFPLRFTADPAALIAFLRTLGMAPVITTEGDGFADLVAGGGGRVMVHGAASSATGAPAGETQLSIAVPEVDPAADRLREVGLEVVVWDESYGRQGNITGPHGEAVGLNEDQQDLYGYVGHDAAAADPRLVVSAVRASKDGSERERDVAFFAALGFTPAGTGSAAWQALVSEGHGVIGLHAPAPGEAASRPGDVGAADLQVSLVRLGFETSEDLGDLASRLTGAGYPARLVEQHGTRSVHLTDPDGQHLEIHPLS